MLVKSEYVGVLQKRVQADVEIVILLFVTNRHIRSVGPDVCGHKVASERHGIFLCRCGPTRAMASSFLRFLDHTKRRTKVGRTPLDE